MLLLLLLFPLIVVAQSERISRNATNDFSIKPFNKAEESSARSIFSPSLRNKHSEDPWISADKFEHLFGSALFSGCGYLILKMHNNDENQSLIASIGVTICLGASKEIYDHYSPGKKASWKDFVVDIIGATLGAFIAQSL